MAVSAAEYETLKIELSVCQDRLAGKAEAVKIFRQQLEETHDLAEQHKQEVLQLRSQLARSSAQLTRSSTHPTSTSPRPDPSREREKFISQLEEAQEKLFALERQLQSVEDEKDEVASERDYYSVRCASLVKCMEEQQSSQPPSRSAFQSLIEENRQLKMQLLEVQAERDQALQRNERYKSLAERKKASEAQDQQLHFISADKHQDLRHSLKRIQELEGLANSLSETVKEKTIALMHQKKANKMLATRIAELEHRLKVLEVSGLWSNSEPPELVWGEEMKAAKQPLLYRIKPEGEQGAEGRQDEGRETSASPKEEEDEEERTTTVV